MSKFLIFNEDTKECSEEDFSSMEEAQRELLVNSKYARGNYLLLPSETRVAIREIQLREEAKCQAQ